MITETDRLLFDEMVEAGRVVLNEDAVDKKISATEYKAEEQRYNALLNIQKSINARKKTTNPIHVPRKVRKNRAVVQKQVKGK